MKTAISIIVLILITLTSNAQVKVPVDPSGSGVPVHTNKKLFIKDGKISDIPMIKSTNKGWLVDKYYEDYYDVELDGYGFGDDNQVPRFYWEMQDSNYTHVGTAFTHQFDYQTFNFTGFSQLNWTANLYHFVIDSVVFNFGHVNHSGIDNTLALTLRQLPVGDLPSANGAILWTDTTLSNNFTDSLDLNVLPTFSVYVGDTLSTLDRGVFFEMYFDGETFLDTGSFLANYWKTTSQCPPGFPRDVDESFTYRDHGLTEGRTYFQNPQESIRLGLPPNTYNSNLDLFVDCNGNNVYDLGKTEAYPIQNIALGIWYSLHFAVGINELDQDLSSLSQNFPNPFSTTSTIDYTLVKSSEVAIEVFDITGKSIMYLNEGLKTVGSHQVTIDGNELNNGIYYYSFMTDSGRVTKKMIVQH